jgi:hypothetical protein
MLNYYNKCFNKIISTLKKIYKSRLKFIFDLNIRLPREKIFNKKVNYKFYSKDILSRNFVLSKKSKKKIKFFRFRR